MFIVTYGHSEVKVENFHSSFDDAYVQYLHLISTLPEFKGFPIAYVDIENSKTGTSMRWRSREAMTFEGVW